MGRITIPADLELGDLVELGEYFGANPFVVLEDFRAFVAGHTGLDVVLGGSVVRFDGPCGQWDRVTFGFLWAEFSRGRCAVGGGVS